jgi:hypothetical protein
MDTKFIKYSGIQKEFKIYSTQVDYENLFNNLSEEIREELKLLTEYYFQYIKTQLENLNTVTLKIYHDKKIDNIPMYLHLYVITDYKPFINIPASITKIGINLTLPENEYISSDYYYLLQNIYILGCNTDNDNEFKNYIYNILFYAYIICKDYQYHPMLSYLNHRDDIPELLKIAKAHINLFGEKINCCVCMEQTITKTTCGHQLCQKCFCSLSKKICPLCRKVLINEYDQVGEIHFYLE